jgi:hypothetical protein
MPSMADSTTSITGTILDKCGKMPASPTIPNGSKATEQELIDAMNNIKTYQSRVADYRVCLNEIADTLVAQEDQEKKQLVYALHDRTVDDEHQTGDLFNSAVRAFKGKK